MKIKNGKIFYRLVIEKNDSTKKELLEFIRTKTTDGEELNKIERIDFDYSNSASVNLHEVRLDIIIKKSEVNLLFGSLMRYEEFSQYLGKWFV